MMLVEERTNGKSLSQKHSVRRLSKIQDLTTKTNPVSYHPHPQPHHLLQNQTLLLPKSNPMKPIPP